MEREISAVENRERCVGQCVKIIHLTWTIEGIRQYPSQHECSPVLRSVLLSLECRHLLYDGIVVTRADDCIYFLMRDGGTCWADDDLLLEIDGHRAFFDLRYSTPKMPILIFLLIVTCLLAVLCALLFIYGA